MKIIQSENYIKRVNAWTETPKENPEFATKEELEYIKKHPKFESKLMSDEERLKTEEDRKELEAIKRKQRREKQRYVVPFFPGHGNRAINLNTYNKTRLDNLKT